MDLELKWQILGPFVVSLSNHERLAGKSFTLRQARGEQLIVQW